jgi:hypothetical protein
MIWLLMFLFVQSIAANEAVLLVSGGVSQTFVGYNLFALSSYLTMKYLSNFFKKQQICILTMK